MAIRTRHAVPTARRRCAQPVGVLPPQRPVGGFEERHQRPAFGRRDLCHRRAIIVLQMPHGHRRQAVIRQSAIPQLTGIVQPPTPNATGSQYRTGVFSARADPCDPRRQPLHSHRRRPRGRGAIAQGTGTIEPPALRPSRFTQSAGVGCAGADGQGFACQPQHRRRRQALRRRAVTQLTKIVPAPALRLPTGQDRTGMGAARTERHDRCVQPHHRHRGQPILLRAIPQFTASVIAPAFDGPRVGQRAGVPIPDTQRSDTALPAPRLPPASGSCWWCHPPTAPDRYRPNT